MGFPWNEFHKFYPLPLTFWDTCFVMSQGLYRGRLLLFFEVNLFQTSFHSSFCNDTPILFLLSAYDAQVAGLYYAVNPNDTGFQVGFFK